VIIRSKIYYQSTGKRYQKPASEGCGTNLKNLISWFPIPKQSSCVSCRNLEFRMNQWGPEKCIKKMPYIMKKLSIAAKRRRLPFSHRLVEILVMRAINGG